ncbi:MAG: flagellar protein FlgN [Fibrobacterales bacterium]
MDKVRKLSETLRELKFEYTKYIECAEEQKIFLIKNDIDSLNKVNITIEVISVDLQDLERQRIQLMEQLAEEAGIEVFSKVIDIQKFYATNPHAKEIVAIAKELKPLFEKVKSINTINNGLISTSRDYIKTTLAIATSVLNRGKKDSFKTYGGTGTVNQGNRQLRSLFNKEV